MRYIILVLLNVPIIVLAFVNFITKYKMKKMTKQRFKAQVALWLFITIILIGSFPIYNHLSGRAPLDSHELSLFDIIQTTAIIYLFYIANSQRQKVETNERNFRDLHQELSIRLSEKK